MFSEDIENDQQHETGQPINDQCSPSYRNQSTDL